MECFESWARVATFEGRIVRERVYFYQDTNIVTYYIFENEIQVVIFSQSGNFEQTVLTLNDSVYSGR